MYCGYCGAKLVDGSTKCIYCSKILVKSTDRPEKKPVNPPNHNNENYPKKDNVKFYKPVEQEKSSFKVLLIIIICILLLGISAALIFLALNGSHNNNSTESYITYESIDSVGEGNFSGQINARATSMLREDGKDFGADNLIDGRTDTCWCEGVEGSGLGEKITLTFNEARNINSIKILGGYCKSEKLYYNNGRPKNINIKFIGEEDSIFFDVKLKDEFATYMRQDNTFYDKPIKQIEITIVDVYAGNKYSDTCISEIIVD